MKTRKQWGLAATLLTLLCVLWGTLSVSAADISGSLDTVDGAHITGWAWKVGEFNELLNVELHIYKDGSSKAEVAIVKADRYSEELQKNIGDGYHAFEYAVDWSKLGGASYKVEAYAVYGEQKTLLPGTKEYKPGSGASSSVAPKADTTDGKTKDAVTAQASTQEKGPGVPSQDVPASSTGASGRKGRSLGMFTTTGYCSCTKCSGGSNRTYSGTVPMPGHTISADISVFPIGTKLMIGDVIYTVEDIGSGVNGRKLDIFYSTHQEALEHGMKTQEVFEVTEE